MTLCMTLYVLFRVLFVYFIFLYCFLLFICVRLTCDLINATYLYILCIIHIPMIFHYEGCTYNDKRQLRYIAHVVKYSFTFYLSLSHIQIYRYIEAFQV